MRTQMAKAIEVLPTPPRKQPLLIVDPSWDDSERLQDILRAYGPALLPVLYPTDTKSTSIIAILLSDTQFEFFLSSPDVDAATAEHAALYTLYCIQDAGRQSPGTELLIFTESLASSHPTTLLAIEEATRCGISKLIHTQRDDRPQSSATDTQVPTLPSTEIPQVVKAGEFFTLGWSYYESRAFMGVAVQDFNLYERLYAYWKRTRVGAEHVFAGDLEEAFTDFMEELCSDGRVMEIKPTIQVIIPCSTGGTHKWELFSDDEHGSENETAWKKMTDHL